MIIGGIDSTNAASIALHEKHGFDESDGDTGNDSILVFKHALVQDAAYAGLLNSEKRRLHAAALAHLETQDSLAATGGSVVLASHAERAEAWSADARRDDAGPDS